MKWKCASTEKPNDGDICLVKFRWYGSTKYEVVIYESEADWFVHESEGFRVDTDGDEWCLMSDVDEVLSCPSKLVDALYKDSYDKKKYEHLSKQQLVDMYNHLHEVQSDIEYLIRCCRDEKI